MFSKKNILSLIISLTLAVTVFGVIRIIQSKIFARDSGVYDYDLILGKGYDWTGPQKGENIDFNLLVNEKNETLFRVSKQKITLLSVVDPECVASIQAGDQIKFLLQESEINRFNYAVITFSPKLSHKEFSQFLKEQNIFTERFLWKGSSENILPSINKMVLPSHILVDSYGTVIKTFPGTNKEQVIRERMANQIIKEIDNLSQNQNNLQK